jgi:hypothetical protein
MKNIKPITTYLIAILSGVTISSLHITHTSNWRYTLPVIMCLMVLRFMIEDNIDRNE